MTMKVRGLAWLGIAAGLCALPAAGRAETPGEILDRMDRAISGYQDQRMDVAMTVVDPGGGRKTYEFTMWQKGTKKRLVRFHTGEMRGMSTLVEDRDRVYVYLPAFRKVRRVAPHSMNQTFAGSDFTNEDMAGITWADAWDGTIEREDADAWWILCTPKPGVASSHPKVRLKVQKGTFYQSMVEYLDGEGRPVRRMESTGLKTFPGGAERYSRVVLADLRTGHRTELEVRDFQVNQGLSDSAFSQRELEWGR